MHNRRRFLKAVAGAGAGGYVLSHMPTALAQATRELYIGGLPMTVVDVHAHCEIKAVEDVVRGTELEMQVRDMRILGPDRIDEMDELGIDIQALHIGTYWWYDTSDSNLARRATTVMNEGMADWVARHPDRFVALATVSLQDPELAAEELEYAVKELGHRGCSIATNVFGEAPTAPMFDVFWAKADELQAPIFVHPRNSEYFIDESFWEGKRGSLGNIVGNPLETGLFLTRMIFDGVFDRHPGLRIVGAHGGGYLPSYSGRTEIACEARGDDANCANQRNPRHYLRNNIYVDSMVFNHEGIEHLVNVMGAGQVVYGTDTPYGWPDTLDLIATCPNLTDSEKAAIVGGNLVKLLRIS